MRAAVRVEWPEARQAAAVQLGDETLAPELMEEAIRDTAEYLAELPPVDVEEARAILARFYRNAVQRKQRAEHKLSFSGTASDIDVLIPSAISPAPAVEAKLDLDTILTDTPAELRYAMLMRYGARSRWEEVARDISKSKDAIRMGCQREVNRIRKRLGIRPRAK